MTCNNTVNVAPNAVFLENISKVEKCVEKSLDAIQSHQKTVEGAKRLAEQLISKAGLHSQTHNELIQGLQLSHQCLSNNLGHTILAAALCSDHATNFKFVQQQCQLPKNFRQNKLSDGELLRMAKQSAEAAQGEVERLFGSDVEQFVSSIHTIYNAQQSLEYSGATSVQKHVG